MTRARVKNAADEEQVKDARDREKLKLEKDQNDLKWVLSMPQGRRFLYRLLEMCGVYKSSFTGSSETFFLEGQRNIGLKVLAEITGADSELYLTMLREAKRLEDNRA